MEMSLSFPKLECYSLGARNLNPTTRRLNTRNATFLQHTQHEPSSRHQTGDCQGMTVRFTITFGDYLAFSLYHYLHSPLILGIYGICFALTTYVNVGVVSEVNTMAGKIITFVILEAAIVGFLALILGIAMVLGIISRRNKTILTEHTITVADDILVEETAFNKTEQKWAGVQKIARTKRHLFIYIAQHLAHVIPLRAFADKAESDAFYEFCRKKSARA